MIAVAMFPLLLLCIAMAPVAGWLHSLLTAYMLFFGLVASVWINALPEPEDAA